MQMLRLSAVKLTHKLHTIFHHEAAGKSEEDDDDVATAARVPDEEVSCIGRNQRQIEVHDQKSSPTISFSLGSTYHV